MHLFGGITILSLLWWYGLQLRGSTLSAISRKFEVWLWFGFGLLLLQIALGGWTSANYAALICPDFPYCQGQLLPSLSWSAFFQSTGIAQSNAALVTIHMAHRLGAVLVGSYLLCLSLVITLKSQSNRQRKWGLMLLGLLVTQITLGVLNVILLLPMYTAVAHNVVAVMIVLVLLSMLARARKSAVIRC